MFTVLVLTHARTALLGEALGSALRLPKAAVVVVNECPWQRLSVPDARVRVVNTDESPTTGEARRRALLEADSEYVQWLDDDDLLMPWCSIRWAYQESQSLPVAWTDPLYWDSHSPSSILHVGDIGYTCINFSASVTAIRRLPAMRAPEDLHMRRALSPDGAHNTHLAPDYLLRRHWTTQHVSQIDRMSDNVGVYRLEAIRRRERGAEPSGAVTVHPRLPPADVDEAAAAIAHATCLL